MVRKYIFPLIIICTSSCVVPYSSYDYDTPRYNYYPYVYYQPTRTIIIKQKPHKYHKKNKRHIKVKINKYKKTK